MNEAKMESSEKITGIMLKLSLNVFQIHSSNYINLAVNCYVTEKYVTLTVIVCVESCVRHIMS